MRRKKFISLNTQQDLEAACEGIDARDWGMVDEFGDDLVDAEYEQRTRWAQRSNGIDDDW